jgi:hypothetical protein
MTTEFKRGKVAGFELRVKSCELRVNALRLAR